MAGLGSLLGGLNPAGIIGNVIGGGLNVIGALGQYDEAKRQAAEGKRFSQSMRSKLDVGYKDLISQAKGLPTYQADITKYTQAQQEAERQKLMASGGGRVGGQAIAEEQARQTTANTLAAAQRGAQSGSDLLTAALLGQQQEGAQMQNIAAQSMQQRQQMQQSAQENYLQQMGVTAAAQAQQAGFQFQSESQKANQILGLGQEQLGQSINLEQNLFEQEMARAAAVQQAKSAIWSGIGGIASGIGSNLMQIQAGRNNLQALQTIYGNKMPPSSVAEFKRFSSGLGDNPSIGFTPTISTLYPNAEGRMGYSSFLPSTTGTIGQ